MNDIFHFAARPYNLRRNFTMERNREKLFISASFLRSQIIVSPTKSHEQFRVS